ncbi:hypothetical protein BZK41_22780 [Citrobacter sp. A316]|nr:hypothetical protein BZK41_22780 [Citrobacter sp. A316]
MGALPVSRPLDAGYFACHFEPGSARNPHVLRVRSGFCALSVFKLPAPITPVESGILILLAQSAAPATE